MRLSSYFLAILYRLHVGLDLFEQFLIDLVDLLGVRHNVASLYASPNLNHCEILITEQDKVQIVVAELHEVDFHVVVELNPLIVADHGAVFVDLLDELELLGVDLLVDLTARMVRQELWMLEEQPSQVRDHELLLVHLREDVLYLVVVDHVSLDLAFE